MESDSTKVLLFVPHARGASNGIAQAVEATLGPKCLQQVQSVGALRDRLRKPRETRLAILVAETGGDLRRLAKLAPLLDNTRVVLVLPDGDDATVAEGHRLRPRVVGWGPDFLSQVPAIVSKMLANDSCQQKEL